MNDIETNIKALEELVMSLDLNFYILHENERWTVDSAIATLARHHHTATVFDIVKAEELDLRYDATLINTIAIIHIHWFDLTAVVDSPRNILRTPPKPDDNWKARYRYDAAKSLIKSGTVMQLQESVFGWEEYLWKEENPDNPVVAVVDVFEDHWSEFTQTDMDPMSKTGITAEVLFQDGQNRRIRKEGTFEEVMRAILG
jgi:hypothetical protein